MGPEEIKPNRLKSAFRYTLPSAHLGVKGGRTVNEKGLRSRTRLSGSSLVSIEDAKD